MNMHELIDVLGRSPSATDVVIQFQAMRFQIREADIEYNEGGWLVVLAVDESHTLPPSRT